MGTIIIPNVFSNGDSSLGGKLQTNFDAIKTVLNGQIDGTNISNSAAILADSLTCSGNITTTSLENQDLYYNLSINSTTASDLIDIKNNSGVSIYKTANDLTTTIVGTVRVATNDLTVSGNITLNGTVLSGYPIGTILMYDGASWIDNSTIIGWYKCDGTNGTPNLIDKFIKGNSTASQTGGSNTKTISANNLPVHTHNTIDHSHTGSTNTTGSHTHTANGYSQYTSTHLYQAAYKGSTTTSSLEYAGDHSHTFTVDGYYGQSGNNTTTATALDVQPSYYTVIYIKRIS